LSRQFSPRSPGSSSFRTSTPGTPELSAVIDGATALAQLAAGLVLGEPSSELAQRLFDRLAPSMDLDCFIHYVVDAEEADGTLRLAGTAGLSGEQIGPIGTLRKGEAVCGMVAHYGEPRRIHDVAASDEPGLELIRHLQMSAYVCHPLLADGDVVGTLSFGSRTRTSFGDAEVALFRTAGDILAASVGQGLATGEAHRAHRAEQSAERAATWLKNRVVALEAQVSALRWEASRRDVVARATGVIMERHRVSADDAVDHLRRTALRHQVPLEELCTHVVAASVGRAS
jgi:signal transduction protein with GAF and PtsI domain